MAQTKLQPRGERMTSLSQLRTLDFRGRDFHPADLADHIEIIARELDYHRKAENEHEGLCLFCEHDIPVHLAYTTLCKLQSIATPIHREGGTVK